MKKLIPVLLSLGCCIACTHRAERLIVRTYIDSLISHYTPPAAANRNEKEMAFWASRIHTANPDYLEPTRYAFGLAMEFRYFGEIDSLRKADSVLLKVDRDFNHKEASALLALSTHCVTQHRFMAADTFLQEAREVGLRPYEALSTAFDVDFELGRYTQAKTELNAIRSPEDYGFWYRRSKLDHLDGQLDSAIQDMNRAVQLTGVNDYLKDVALANAGDLYLHAGNLRKAAEAYRECVRLNSADFHSLMGLGWIALVNDRDDSLAEKVFRFARTRNRLPDPLFKLAQISAFRRDTAGERGWADSFMREATEPVYGRMYNKYLIQLYTGVLHRPDLAEAIAKDELDNRATPQTYAWYVWALLANNKKEAAYRVYQQHVSGQPLEALELYWMGRLMEALGKNYNALQFFSAANLTRFDLDPTDAAYIENKLEE